MDRLRLWLGERLAGYREWIGQRDPVRFEWVMLACVVAGITVILVTAYLPGLGSLSAGDTAPYSVVADRNVTVVDSVATETLRDHVAELVEPVYTADPVARDEALAALTAFFATADGLRAGLAAEGKSDAALAAAKQQLRGAAPGSLTDETLGYLLAGDAAAYAVVRTQAIGTLQAVFNDPIIQASLPDARARARSLALTLSTSTEIATAVYEVAAAFLRPNQVVDEQQTLARQKEVREEVAPITLTVREGDEVLVEGRSSASRTC
jgi:membrane-associated HD superfamily phosphohydrolase